MNASGPPPPEEGPSPDAAPRLPTGFPRPAPDLGWGRLARQIRERTTNLVATVLVLGAGLLIGRQTLVWWRAAPPVATARPNPQASQWGAGDTPVLIEFGDGPFQLARREFGGTSDEAWGLVYDGVRAHARSLAEPPAEPATPAELRMLAAVEKETPDVEEPGFLQLHRIGGGMPIVVAVREFESSAGRVRRLVSWGLAFPLGFERWGIYVVQFGARSAGQGAPRLDMPLPPGAERTLTLTDQHGAQLTGFRGTGDVRAWQQHFTTVPQQPPHAWIVRRPWEPSGAGWRLQLAAGSAPDAPTADIQLTPDGAAWHGMITVGPQADAPAP